MPVELSTMVKSDKPVVPDGRRRWLSTVSHLDPRYGGLSAAIPQLASRLAASDRVDVSIGAFCLPGEHYRLSAYPDLAVSYWPTSRRAWLIDGNLRRRFCQMVADADGLHIHGLWEQNSLYPARAARALHKPYIVSAHGMLEPWALARSRTKKQVYAALFERATLQGAACLHALTLAEAGNYRDFGCRQPIAVIPNGVDVPRYFSPDLFLEAFPSLLGKRIMIFLGRLHQKKGVELLVRAWACVHARSSNAHLVIGGPSEDDTRARVEHLVGELGLTDQVSLPGMLAPAMKWSALAAAECFVLPSYSEGLSIATLEAMGAGLPVIVSEHCNLPEVHQVRAGWQVRAEEDDLASAVQSWLDNSSSSNSDMGKRGAALIKQRYSWATVAAQMAELYAWVANGADDTAAPPSVYFAKAQVRV